MAAHPGAPLPCGCAGVSGAPACFRGCSVRTRSFVSLVAVLAVAFTLLAPAAASADGGTGGPFFLAVADWDAERYVRGGRVLQEGDFTEDFRPRPGDQIFFAERLYNSNARGAKGTRAGRTMVHCTIGVRMMAFCDGTLYLRGQGELYVTTSTADTRRFLIAVLGGTRDFKASRGDIVATGLTNRRTLYQLRLR